MKKISPVPKPSQAFSLLEVMIAIGIFFATTFAILAVVTTSLSNARRLQRPQVSAGMLAGELSLTNSLTEGSYSGDFGELHPDFTWDSVITEEQTNKLFRVDYIVQSKAGDKPVTTKMTILLFRPQSPAGSLDGGTTAGR